MVPPKGGIKITRGASPRLPFYFALRAALAAMNESPRRVHLGNRISDTSSSRKLRRHTKEPELLRTPAFSGLTN